MSHTNRPGPAPVWSPHLIEQLASTLEPAAAAALLAAHRVPVMACVPNGKRPLLPHGFHDATIDRTTVEAWWHRWPDANVAIPTGFASGVDVVDVDVHAAGDGYRSFSNAQSTGFANGWAWLTRTPSGGMHAYYLRTAPGEQRCWQAPKHHIDFRGDGGYIVLPPSRTDAGTYRITKIAQGRPRSVDGPGLRNFLDPPSATPPSTSWGHRGADRSRLAEWVAAQGEGGRNRGLFWAACRMVEHGDSYANTVATLAPAAQHAGLDERETLATIRSAFRSAGSSQAGRRSPPVALERRRPPLTISEGIDR